MCFKNKVQKIINLIFRNKSVVMRWFIVLVIIQSLFSIYGIIQIPVDPKNVTTLGLTRARLALIALILGLDTLGIIVLFSLANLKDYLKSHWGYTKLQHVLQAIALTLMFIFWIALWLPKYRLGEFSEEYQRARPFLLWLGAAGTELFMLLRIFSVETHKKNQIEKPRYFGKSFVVILLITFCFAGLFFYLRANSTFSSGIIEPASSPVTPLQLFLLWFISIVASQVFNHKPYFRQALTLVICAVGIYLVSAAIFLAASLPCKGDMVGIYPPNYVCYPDVHDAVYHIGSLYTYYGEGIYNQWFTDKPLYMLFLTICQWIGGTQIQGTMTTQVLFLSLLPVLIFLLTHKLADYPTALMASLLTVVAQYNSILLYSKLGGVNIRIAASEILTALLLTISVWSIQKWFRKPTNSFFALATGVILGMTILTRFNAIVIVPILVLAVFALYKKNMRSSLRSLASFGMGLVIILSPWFLLNPLLNANLNNPYLEKIQNVFVDRSISQTGSKVREKIPEISLLSRDWVRGLSDDQIPAAQAVILEPFEGIDDDHVPELPEQAALHFVNNLMSAFFSLPVNSSFSDSGLITEQSFWYRDNQTIWQREMHSENLLLWCLSVFLFTWGVGQSWRRWGLSGLAPLIVLVGYLLGVSLALTSGGRYIVPILWIVFLYYSVGLVSLTGRVIEALGFQNNSVVKQVDASAASTQGKISKYQTRLNKPAVHFTALGLLIASAISLPFLQLLPDKLPPEQTRAAEQTAYSYLENELDMTNWNAFLAEENSVVVDGMLFFPQYYSQSRFSKARGTDVFEALVLSRDFVYMSYMWNRMPEHVTDGSEVLLVGCILKEGSLWEMERRIMQTYAIIQLDNEKMVYLDHQADWTCQ
jgi:4-amino-4-deoxy-L-arabinose transferase-like glycosyltransferase/cbb3-type cytochrome oxidase subunit 3